MRVNLFFGISLLPLCASSILLAEDVGKTESAASLPAVEVQQGSIDDLRVLASKGSAQAACEIARRYVNGELKPYDPAEYFSYALSAAEAGLDEGKLLVARSYITGLPGVCGKHDFELGWDMMKELSDKGNAEAQARYAGLMLAEFKDDMAKGTLIGNAKREECDRLLDSSIKKGNPRAMLIQGLRYMTSGKVEEGLKLLQQASALGDAGAMYTLSDYYYSINEEEKSIEFLKKSSDRGHAMAMALLAMDYFKGTEFIEKDNYKAIIMMEEAAMRGYVAAQAVLGIILLDNYESSDLRKQGVYWVRTAAENDQPDAIEYIRNHVEKFDGEYSN